MVLTHQLSVLSSSLVKLFRFLLKVSARRRWLEIQLRRLTRENRLNSRNSLVPRLRDDVFFVNEWTRQGDCLTLFLVVIAAGRRSAQRRILAEHGECSLMMRGNGLQRSGLDDRTSTDAVNRVTDIEQGRRIMDAGGSLVHPCSLFNCHRRVASELDRAAE